MQETPEQTAPGATPRATLTFGGLVKVPLNQTVTLLTTNGLVFKGHCAPSTNDPSAVVGSISVSSDEAGSWYSSFTLYTGAIEELGPTLGDVTVYSYDTSCEEPGGPFYSGGIAFSVGKPSGISANGVMSCGVGLFGADSAFSGLVIL